MRARETLSVLWATLVAGLAAGGADIGVAAVINKTEPGRILQAVASGLLGLHAYTGGAYTVALGLVLQIAISVVIAGVYAAGARRLPVLLRHPSISGLAYGVLIFGVMNMVVAPLSAFAPKPHVTTAWLALNVVAMLLFGWIVAHLVQIVLKKADSLARFEAA
jgi:hypothetical protein